MLLLSLLFPTHYHFPIYVCMTLLIVKVRMRQKGSETERERERDWERERKKDHGRQGDDCPADMADLSQVSLLCRCRAALTSVLCESSLCQRKLIASASPGVGGFLVGRSRIVQAKIRVRRRRSRRMVDRGRVKNMSNLTGLLEIAPIEH